MLKISWKLDNEDGPDPVDPTGEIYLSSGGTGSIFEKYTYLDSWFDALADGFLAAKNGVPGIMEILEEPDALKFEPLGHGGVRVAYKDQNIELRDTDHALCILRESVRVFLSEFGGDRGILKNRLLIKLKDFIVFTERYDDESCYYKSDWQSSEKKASEDHEAGKVKSAESIDRMFDEVERNGPEFIPGRLGG